MCPYSTVTGSRQPHPLLSLEPHCRQVLVTLISCKTQCNKPCCTKLKITFLLPLSYTAIEFNVSNVSVISAGKGRYMLAGSPHKATHILLIHTACSVSVLQSTAVQKSGG